MTSWPNFVTDIGERGIVVRYGGWRLQHGRMLLLGAKSDGHLLTYIALWTRSGERLHSVCGGEGGLKECAMNRRSVLGLIAIIGAFSAIRRAAAWELISKEQAEAVSSKPTEKEVPPPQDPKAPVIEVDAPDISKPVKTPVSIRLRFKPQAGTTIDPKTFQAKYGWFDITNQILANAKVDASGLTADNAQVPTGRYRVTLQIADTSGHVGVKAIEFTVV